MNRKPVDLQAYELYLQGAHIYSHETSERLEACRQKFEQAIERDPNFARAWGYLAYATMRSVMLGWRPNGDATKAEEYAKKAVELDPDDYANYWDLAFIYQGMRRFDLAEELFDKAIRLDGNDADLLAEVADMHTYVGEPERSIAELHRAMRLNPIVPDWYRWNLGWAYFNARQYESAIRELDKIIEPPGHALLIKAASYQMLDRHTDAEGQIRRYLETNTGYSLRLLKQRMAFKKPEFEQHWLSAVRAAGLPEAYD
jgi:Tfp pilus assembly protein PilF